MAANNRPFWVRVNALGLPPKVPAQREADTGMIQVVHNITARGRPHMRGSIEKIVMFET